MGIQSTTKTTSLVLIGTFITAGILGGCAAGPEGVAENCVTTYCLVQKGMAPKWIIKPGVYSGDNSGVIYGVGIASNISNTGLLRRSAESQARRSIAQFMGTEIEGLLEQYYESTSEGAEGKDVGGQDVQDFLRELTKETLHGVSIAEYWQNPYKNEIYSLARMDMDKFEQVLAKLANLKGTSAELVKVIRENKDKIENKMEGLLEKRGKLN